MDQSTKKGDQLAPYHAQLLVKLMKKGVSNPLTRSGLAATAVGKTETALGAFYRRLSARIGKAKAVTATARKIAVLFYNTLRHGRAYEDPGASYYEQKYRQRVVDGLRRRAASMGFTLEALPDQSVS